METTIEGLGKPYSIYLRGTINLDHEPGAPNPGLRAWSLGLPNAFRAGFRVLFRTIWFLVVASPCPPPLCKLPINPQKALNPKTNPNPKS